VLGHNHFDDNSNNLDVDEHDLDFDYYAYVHTDWQQLSLHRRHSVLQQNLRQSQLPRLLLRVPLPWRVLHRRRNVL